MGLTYGLTLGNMILTGALRPLATATMTWGTRVPRVRVYERDGGGGGVRGKVGVEVRVRRGRGEGGRQSDEGEAWGAAVSKT